MASKTVIQQRRNSVAEMLEDAHPIRIIAEYFRITPETIAKDWREIEEEYRKNNGYDETIRPHTVYRLALCTKIDILLNLQYSQLAIARLLKLSQSSVSRLAKWSEVNGIYSKTCIRISVNERVKTVDGEREVQPGGYFVGPMNEQNCWLSQDEDDDGGAYIVRYASLVGNHKLVSAYKHEYSLN